METTKQERNDFLTCKEVAEILRVRKEYVRKLAAQRIITSYRLGAYLRFKSEDVDEFMSRCRNAMIDQPC